MSRSYDNAQLKRKLRGAVEELEQQGFLEPADWSGRFRNVSRGRWTVSFTRRRPRPSQKRSSGRRNKSAGCGAKRPLTAKTPRSRPRQPHGRDQAARDKFRRRMDDYWKSLSTSRQRRLLAAAIEAAPVDLRETLERVNTAGETLLVEVYEKIILEKHLAQVLKRLGRGKAA